MVVSEAAVSSVVWIWYTSEVKGGEPIERTAGTERGVLNFGGLGPPGTGDSFTTENLMETSGATMLREDHARPLLEVVWEYRTAWILRM